MDLNVVIYNRDSEFTNLVIGAVDDAFNHRARIHVDDKLIDVVKRVSSTKLDVAFLNYADRTSDELIRIMKTLDPHVALIAFAECKDDCSVLRFFRAGGDDFICLCDVSGKTIRAAVDNIYDKHSMVSAQQRRNLNLRIIEMSKRNAERANTKDVMDRFAHTQRNVLSSFYNFCMMIESFG